MAAGSCCARLLQERNTNIAANRQADLFVRMLHFVPVRCVLYSGAMQNILRTIEFLCLSLWLGADAFLSFVVAPGAFAVLADRDAAGLVVGYSLSRMHAGGMILGILFLVVRSLRTRSFGSLVT